MRSRTVSRHHEVSDTVSELRIESSLITARVGDRQVTLSAPADLAGRLGGDRRAGHARPPVARARAAARAHVGGAARARGARARRRRRRTSRRSPARLPRRSSATPRRCSGSAAMRRRPAKDDEAWQGGELPPLAAARPAAAGLGAEALRYERDPDRRRRTRRGACSGLPCFWVTRPSEYPPRRAQARVARAPRRRSRRAGRPTPAPACSSARPRTTSAASIPSLRSRRWTWRRSQGSTPSGCR